MPGLDFDDIQPYKSALIAYQPDGAIPPVRGVLQELAKVLKVKQSGGRRIRSLRAIEASTEDGWGLLHYSHRQPASWAMPGVTDADDITNYLVVVVRRGAWVAILLTENGRRGSLTRALNRGQIHGLRRVPPSLIKGAFVAGKPRTLWLKGTHRRDTVKADNKVLTGRDLRDALDPIADQTYRYTAVRCEAPGPLGDVIGVAVDQARIWAGSSAEWQEFLDAMQAALDIVSNASPMTAELLPVLAIAGADLTGVEQAFDLGITPPELLTIGPTNDPSMLQMLEAAEQLAYNTRFEVTGAPGTVNLSARVYQNGTHLGDLDLDLAASDGRVEARVTNAAPASGRQQAFTQVKRCCEDPDMLAVFYESGHSIVDGQVCSIRHRDVEFDGFAWADFAGYDVDREKPTNMSQIGSDGSLFCWMASAWPHAAGVLGHAGWLLCDDRPGETCDFIHLDESDTTRPPLLSLIHVKGAHSASTGRRISVVAYETVVGQAIKNLRHLDTKLLAQGVAGAVTTSATPPVWHDRQARPYADFQQHIANVGTNVRRRVVIVQPHVTQTALITARAATSGSDLARRQQLETLLVGARANVQGMGAELVVIGDRR